MGLLLLRYIVLLATILVFISDSVSGKSVTITVLHVNDIHGRFLETNRDSLACSAADSKNRKCYGGYARLFTKVNEIRRTHANVILLSGGDYDQGTLWHTVYKWKAFTHFTNMFNYTAMTLGNHEFDDSVHGAVSLLDDLNSPVVVSNIIDSQEPSLQGKYSKSIVVETGGRRLGIIGYITITTETSPERVRIIDQRPLGRNLVLTILIDRDVWQGLLVNINLRIQVRDDMVCGVEVVVLWLAGAHVRLCPEFILQNHVMKSQTCHS